MKAGKIKHLQQVQNIFNIQQKKYVSLKVAILHDISFNLIPVDGEWSEWGAWSPCTGSCGAATKTRTRSCDDPPPSSNGQFCVGRSHQTMACSPAGGQCEDAIQSIKPSFFISINVT